MALPAGYRRLLNRCAEQWPDEPFQVLPGRVDGHPVQVVEWFDGPTRTQVWETIREYAPDSTVMVRRFSQTVIDRAAAEGGTVAEVVARLEHVAFPDASGSWIPELGAKRRSGDNRIRRALASTAC